MEIYEVGGAVRDRLLGLAVKDRDWVVVGATPEQMLALGYRQVGRDFPVFLHPDSKEEYALARTERKSGKGHKGFVVHAAPDVTLEQDLLRRDLTINAIARNSKDELIDPCQGQADLAARLLRHVSPAFTEDPLRVLRVARFAARLAGFGFRVAPETMALMRRMVDGGELAHLVPERIWQEVRLALCCDQPQVFFTVLKDCGALAELMPALDQCKQALPALQEAARLSAEPQIRFAALMHALDPVVVDSLCRQLRVPNDFRELATLTSRCHDRCLQALQQGAKELLLTLELADALRRPARFKALLLACQAILNSLAGPDSTPSLQSELLLVALAAARAVDAATLASNHPRTDDLLAVLRKTRLQAIAEAMKSAEKP